MEILNLSLSATNRFASNYLEQSPDILPFFHYRFNDITEDQRRLDELSNRYFPRENVADYIEKFMERFPSSQAVTNSLEKLKQKNSVVVIGGQQAGILTGPLYSIHKVISIIKLAAEKERQLGVPVIPVFWIAGEDHDFHEVNHVFIPVEQRVGKSIYPEKTKQKKMVSDILLNEEVCREWVTNLIEDFGETHHTKDLLSFAEEALVKSTTFVDFFANIVMELFKDYGLLIVDSGDRHFRLLQKENFSGQIEHHREITSYLLEQQSVISKNGFPITIDSNENAANLFYYHPRSNERILLEFDSESNCFVGKSGVVSFTKEELSQIALQNPALLSNNVVTRPLMQEWLFPTLAFIAGPGEISYWAELKLVFEHFKIKMPPIVPRLNISLLERAVESDINELKLDLSTVLSRGSAQERDQFLESIKDREVSELFSSLKSQILKQYELIETKTNQHDPSLLPLLKKNENFLLKQIGFMETKLEASVQSKFDVVLNKFNRIDLSLRPDGFPQERVWNIFYYLNQYGTNFIKELMELEFEFDGRHKVIKL
ncbi:bacillithiol biosynthesis cysteine-adding enzyme BshC [Bacillus sp. OK048]|uniref:bacillithiol biosynthesis cysteine-adding enzyme BshC n=1 Tax=Bacillus sp. OK048 TaxID=1882761 RepID=UPI0008881269|nr:bacillithiol biosynthesis cysteine-adding enzyme BshC [Bacillus sp. OK048]SDM04155.1 bacillithiol biosynthesis cysteine-adding enzyme BshC [Bacillus sp. OK048]